MACRFGHTCTPAVPPAFVCAWSRNGEPQIAHAKSNNASYDFRRRWCVEKGAWTNHHHAALWTPVGPHSVPKKCWCHSVYTACLFGGCTHHLLEIKTFWGVIVSLNTYKLYRFHHTPPKQYHGNAQQQHHMHVNVAERDREITCIDAGTLFGDEDCSTSQTGSKNEKHLKNRRKLAWSEGTNC